MAEGAAATKSDQSARTHSTEVNGRSREMLLTDLFLNSLSWRNRRTDVLVTEKANIKLV